MSGRLVNVDDYAEAARQRLDPGPYGYVVGGAGDEHTIYYCPRCQTGGRVLKDRRMSRLLR